MIGLLPTLADHEHALHLRAISIDASRARRDGVTPVEWIVSWYTPCDIPRENALDEMNRILSSIVGWT